MADEKKTKLSIVIRTVDQATAKLNAINARLDAIAKPTRDFRKALGELRAKSGLDDVIAGFRGVGSALSGVLSKLGILSGMAVGAGLALKSLVDDFSTLDDVAQRFGSGVDTVAQLRYVAARSGASAEQMDKALDNLGKNMGELRAKGGPMLKFLEKVSPTLLKQIKGTKNNEEAFLLLADAMAKIQDPAKRAIFAQKTLGDPALARTLGRGSKGIAELRKRYAELAGSQEDAANASGDVGDSMHDLRAAIDGVKAALVTGLAPALKVVVERLREWFTAHRADIAEWARNIGEKLPGAIREVVAWVGRAVDKVRSFVDSIGGLKTIAIALGAALVAGPVIAIGKLTVALGSAALKAAALAKELLGVKAASDAAAGADAAGGRDGDGGRRRKRGARGRSGGFSIGRMGMALLNPGDIEGSDGRTISQTMDEIGRLMDQGFTLDAARNRIRGIPSLAEIALQAMQARAGQSEAKITIDIKNAPPGTRVSTDPQSSADVDLSVGYQMLPGGP